MTKREKINQITNEFLSDLSKEQQDKVIQRFENMGTRGAEEIVKILRKLQSIQQSGRRVSRLTDKIEKKINQIADEQ